MKTAVRYRPRKEIVIHELVPYDNVKDMLNDLVLGLPDRTQTLIFRWVGGVLLFFTTLLPDTDTLAKERINGIIHWDSVIFAKMEKFESVIKHEGRIFYVLDASKSETFKEIGIFLQKSLNQSKRTRKPTQ